MQDMGDGINLDLLEEEYWALKPVSCVNCVQTLSHWTPG